MDEIRQILAEEERPLHRREYDLLVQEGVFDHERVQLLFGMLVRMSPQGARHIFVILEMNERLTLAVAGRARVAVQLPVAFDALDSEPEPDIAILPRGDYSKDVPTSAHLVVEVAEASLLQDRKIKAPLYARGGVPEYWIVNLKENVVEVYRDPNEGAYRSVTRHGRGETIHPLAFPDVAIHISEILPPE